MRTGSCLCGAVAFELSGDLAPIEICHCSQCRKAQGGPFATNIPVPTAQLRFIRGESDLSVYTSSPGKERVFCCHCGSPVFSRRAARPDVVRIRAGLIDGPVNAPLASHAFTGSKADWWPIDDDLPQYPGPRQPS